MNYTQYFLPETWNRTSNSLAKRIPRLFMAPMEGVGDRPFRAAMAAVGGFDEICTEFLRVPNNAHVESLAAKYDPDELGNCPLAVQIMGMDLHLMGAMAYLLKERRAPRIELNCGCPSNTVTGKGAGASLLKTPQLLHDIAKEMVVAAHPCPVSLKMRLGYENTDLFFENLQAAANSGVQFITIHGRTKEQRYTGYSNWQLIAEAKKRISIPLVGNGDVCSVEDARHLFQITGCDGIMIGRGAVSRPWFFHQIRSVWGGEPSPNYPKLAHIFIHTYDQALGTLCGPDREPLRLSKWKQMINYMLHLPEHAQIKHELLRRGDCSAIIKTLLELFAIDSPADRLT